jgi:predicted ester cyclase
VPDLRAEIEELIVADDRAVSRLHFTGHFTGSFGAARGQGQSVDFHAFDVYRVANGRIVENWHLEDNLTLLRQLGLIAGP